MNKFHQIITELWPLIDVQYYVLLNIILTNGQILIFFVTKYPVAGCEKTCLRDFRPDPTQTRLYNHRRWLEA